MGVVESHGRSERSFDLSHEGQTFRLEMDSIDELRGMMVLGATNRPDLIDPVLLRLGRFDLVVELPVPDYDARYAILEVHCRGRKLSSNVSLTHLAEITDGMNGAELESL